ncbi:SDR family NAD(P)-dependent oxidoreductase [Desulfamplus magnetovallimortis]|nr:SDR family NAD(P)-dependent oxidoreductase [Desulfamplus magnetovallimortis]
MEKIAENSEILAMLTEKERIALVTAAGKISRPDRKEIKKRNKEKKRLERVAVAEKEKKLRAATGIRKAREAEVFVAPVQISYGDHKHLAFSGASDEQANSNSEDAPIFCSKNHSENEPPELKSPRNCYVCKAEFTKLHHFYDTMCPECAEFNYQKRFQTASLKGQTALITGSRLKIGYQATLMMLRAGARVIATTRFPKDSALRFSREPDFSQWKHRLHIYGLDLRHIPSVEIFADFIEKTYQRLDILINNAAQTVRRPPGFYAHLMENENIEISDFPPDVQALLYDYQECLFQLGGNNGGYKETEEIAETTEKTSEKTDIIDEDPAMKADTLLKGVLPANYNQQTSTSSGIGLSMSAKLSQFPYSCDHSLDVQSAFPTEKLDADLQQVDLRKTNSWRLKLGEIETSEMLEIQLVNSVAPFVLCNRLTDLMKKDYTGKKHIVNVSAMEGKFLRFKKGSRHPHTNMAKAALNMLTHTAADGLAKYGIFMNAVDTGWVTDEDPAILAKLKQERHDFQPPLDIVDGAARVCDPFFHGIITGKHWCGKFLKDYFPIDW